MHLLCFGIVNNCRTATRILTHNIDVTRRAARVIITGLARVSSSTFEIHVTVHRSERLDVRLEGQAAGGGAGRASGGEQGVVVTLS